ncbi:hypothetical protein [Neisseria shayeganii]|uniref:Uncharacterized protein n=1 Tax=Neisseria shayeganii TaxID=607712 RepID=A0A7D7RN64_9NEIS|nr:hypothetical protein [Neisseria shayeganii]QMT40782.1 hypothetical protein H3L94_01615 [Neisseria shayeganii]
MADSLADFAFLQLTYATKQQQSKTILKKSLSCISFLPRCAVKNTATAHSVFAALAHKGKGNECQKKPNLALPAILTDDVWHCWILLR